MIVISWDVGVIHLAYCILNYTTNGKESSVEILDWDEINLMEDNRISFDCCGLMKAKKGEAPKVCGKKATYYQLAGCMGKTHGFCKTHLLQSSQYWSNKDTEKLFKTVAKGHQCNYPKSDGSECDKGAKYFFKEGDEQAYYCTPHYKSVFNKKIKEYSPQLIKNLIVKKYPTSQLQLTLVQKLDSLIKHFAKLGIEEVIIENQPSMKNPKMKAIASTLFDYFMIRGYLDKIHNLDIKLVRFMCPSNKLKVNNKNTIEVFRANKDTKVKYKLTKALGIEYTRKLISTSPKQIQYLELYKKKDDICDAYLQGRYYLEFVKNKQNLLKKKADKKANVMKKSKPAKKSKPPKKYSGSKTTKKLPSNKKSKKNKKDVIVL